MHTTAACLVPAALLVLVGLAGCGTETATSPTGATPTPSVPPTPTPTPTASATPQRGWLTTIPPDLRVDTALPEPGGDFSRGKDGVELEFCGDGVGPEVPVTDRRTASAAGPEYGEGRDLRVFRDDERAGSLLAAVLEEVESCPEDEASSTIWRHEVWDSHLQADEAFTVVRTYVTADGYPVLGATFWEVARVGNAVLLTATGGEYDAASTLEPGIRDHAADLTWIVDSLCIFAAEPCADPPVRGSSTHPTVVGPIGLGGIPLGADASLIEGIGGEVTDRRSASGCRVVDLWVNDGPDLDGFLEPALGLSVIRATAAARTDRDVGTGSTYDEVRAAYPHGHGDDQLYTADLPGLDDRHWRFWFDGDGRVDEFMLLLDDQHCGG